MDNTGKFIGGILIGAAVGAALGILLAPARGSETRQRIKDGAKDLANDLKDRVKDGAGKLGDMAEEQLDNLRSKVRGEKTNVNHQTKTSTSSTGKVRTDEI